EVFPKMPMHPNFRQVTLLHLLSHRSGLPTRTWPKGKSFTDIHKLPGNQRQQRLTYIKMMLGEAPAAKPGEKFMYSNAGFAVAGAIAEKVCNKGYQALIAEKLFKPLGMTSYGSGAMGDAEKLDQPWPHQFSGGKASPIRPGRYADNPPAIAPAGTLHMSLSDWGKFVSLHLQAYNGEPKLLSKKTLKLLHNPIFGGSYGLGWVVTQRPWGKGKVFVHNGSNTMNFCVVWVAPKRDFAVLIACNAGGQNAAKACDRVAGLMIQRFLTNPKKALVKKPKKKLY
ncbi:MAG: serine hydrolase, partial [Planctomycetota bacterium]|nr:serine hydrolase [Planctomycetota bacterium]